MQLTNTFGSSSRMRWTVAAAPVVAMIASIVSASVTPAQADPLFQGPATCIGGFVPRAARPGDAVCVTTDMHSTVAQQNTDPGAKKDPNGAYGPQSCAQGFVWRQAFDGDVICVTPEFRTQVLADNAASASRNSSNGAGNPTGTQKGTLTFEVTGSGEVYGIVTDPATAAVGDGATAPWTRTITDPGDSLYQLVVTTKNGAQGCRITLDGRVVAEEPIGNSPHCIYTP